MTFKKCTKCFDNEEFILHHINSAAYFCKRERVHVTRCEKYVMECSFFPAKRIFDIGYLKIRGENDSKNGVRDLWFIFGLFLIYKIVYEIYFSDLPLVKIFYSAFCLEVDDNNNIKSCSFIYQHLLIDIYFISLFAAKS